jgi:hypothetical protein
MLILVAVMEVPPQIPLNLLKSHKVTTIGEYYTENFDVSIGATKFTTNDTTVMNKNKFRPFW